MPTKAEWFEALKTQRLSDKEAERGAQRFAELGATYSFAGNGKLKIHFQGPPFDMMKPEPPTRNRRTATQDRQNAKRRQGD